MRADPDSPPPPRSAPQARRPSRELDSGPSTRAALHLLARQRSAREPKFAKNPHGVLSDRVVIAMVGLPARGKSYISNSIVRYLCFLGCPARLFNAGSKRRTAGLAGESADFFDASNESGVSARDAMAMECLDELLLWLQSETAATAGCACAILDATNTTVARRTAVRRRVEAERPAVKLVTTRGHSSPRPFAPTAPPNAIATRPRARADSSSSSSSSP